MRNLQLKIKHIEDYRKLRRLAYPTIGEQLDALWHDMNAGKVEKSETFFNLIQDVKTKFPKEVK
jgi:hypothetical protein